MSENLESPEKTNAHFNGPEITAEDIITLKKKIVSNSHSPKVLAKETIEIQNCIVQPTSCTNAEYANDLSFSSRYAYDSFCFLNFFKKPTEQLPPVNKSPEFTPWRERYEKGIPDPEPRTEEETIMEDTEPHYLLQDQAGYLLQVTTTVMHTRLYYITDTKNGESPAVV